MISLCLPNVLLSEYTLRIFRNAFLCIAESMHNLNWTINVLNHRSTFRRRKACFPSFWGKQVGWQNDPRASRRLFLCQWRAEVQRRRAAFVLALDDRGVHLPYDGTRALESLSQRHRPSWRPSMLDQFQYSGSEDVLSIHSPRKSSDERFSNRGPGVLAFQGYHCSGPIGR